MNKENFIKVKVVWLTEQSGKLQELGLRIEPEPEFEFEYLYLNINRIDSIMEMEDEYKGWIKLTIGGNDYVIMENMESFLSRIS